MRCPSLDELPPPPPGKTGWPWTEASRPVSGPTPTGGAWPRISIVTPSYNQGSTLEETIRSVILQGYPNIEYVVMDGNSGDESVTILRKYERWISWVSEPDRGQSHAINKGLRRASGAILGYINSDDLYMPNAFETVASNIQPNSMQLMWGDICVVQGGDWSTLTRLSKSHLTFQKLFLGGTPLPQPATFWTQPCLEKIGLLQEQLHYAMDYDFILRLLCGGATCTYLPKALAIERQHAAQKSRSKEALYREKASVRLAVARELGMNPWWYIVRALLFQRLLDPSRLHRWRTLTMQENLLISAMRGNRIGFDS